MNDYPTFDVGGQVALVTGAARGLGRAIALTLADAGADVALGLRDVTTGDALADEIRAMGRRALPLQLDVSDVGQSRAAVQRTVAELGRLDILVNNAGIAPGNPAQDVRVEDFDATVAVNLKGTFFAS
ncbi:MAG TPA: SDR family NAD(P)-dependent oxidoreductase, partial [Solirubrobacteraceae bacterium]|nr:SDR family NAD(P)-dependent oxidoreductase [Solirubrobacteraceae bacterium]